MWPLQVSRHLALLFAVGLAIAEALINMSLPKWQYAPLWIIDYAIAAALLGGFWVTRKRSQVGFLMAAWALAVGVFYMALFISLDPQLNLGVDRVFLGLVAFALLVQLVGLGLAVVAQLRGARS